MNSPFKGTIDKYGDLGDLSDLIKLAEANEPGTIIVTENSAALAFAEAHVGKLLFDHQRGSWFRWTGAYWQEENTRLAFEWVRNLIRGITENEPVRVKASARKKSFANGVEAFAQCDRRFAVCTTDWDADPYLLATPNGTVDLRTGKVRPADPMDRISKITSVAPSETADCNRWLQFLDEATARDDELIRFLQRWCGYCLIGDVREHALVFCYGPGGNGKTVMLNTVSGILGGYAQVAAMETFTVQKFASHPTDLAMLRGARLVSSSETEEGRAWAETRIKQLTGGDPISARFMRQDFFTYTPQFKLMIIGNHEPTLRSVDDAARRRFNVVPFIRKPARVDKELQHKLRAEWPGILRWMINGCLEWQDEGLSPPETVRAATAKYFDNQDLFGQWLEERCEIEPGDDDVKETSGNLFQSWQAFAKAAGDTAGSRKGFARLLEREAKVQPDREAGTGRRIWKGIRLKPVCGE